MMLTGKELVEALAERGIKITINYLARGIDFIIHSKGEQYTVFKPHEFIQRLAEFGIDLTIREVDDKIRYQVEDIVQPVAKKENSAFRPPVPGCDCEDCKAALKVTKAPAQPIDLSESMREVAGIELKNEWVGNAPPVDLLHAAAETFKSRNALYGNSYHSFGDIFAACFPNGMTLKTPEDFKRLGVFNMIVSKIIRYAANLQDGGHYDSAHDLMVYAAMLAELTEKKA